MRLDADIDQQRLQASKSLQAQTSHIPVILHKRVPVTAKAVEESSAVDSQGKMFDKRESFGQDFSGERGEDVRTGKDERVVGVEELDAFTVAVIWSVMWRVERAASPALKLVYTC
jgi:hypothetical protein